VVAVFIYPDLSLVWDMQTTTTWALFVCFYRKLTNCLELRKVN
jgi:hypothetical protein